MNERHRDLRQKFQIKLQEKNIKISELKTTINQIYLCNPQLRQQTPRMGSMSNPNNLQSIHSNPNMNIMEQLSDHTHQHHTSNSISEVLPNQGLNHSHLNIINERQKLQKPPNYQRKERHNHSRQESNDNLGITSFSGADKSGMGVSVVTSPGEIYSMI